MKKLFQKQKHSKVSKDFAEPEPYAKQSIPTPLYQRLATHGAHIHGTISMPVFQQSTNQSLIPSPTEDQQSANQQSLQEVGHLPNPHSPPAINTPTRSNSFHASTQISTTTVSGIAPPRSISPVSTLVSNGHKVGRVHDLERIKPSAVTAVGILSSLEPPRTDGALTSVRDERERQVHSQVSVSESGHGQIHVEKEKRRGFWNVRDKEREREKDRERERDWQREMQLRKEREQRDNRGKEPQWREDESQGELTRMIGYLTATASQDWALMLEVCERASATEASAKEAVRALRREFKYGEPAAQLSAAKVWAVMLRNSSEVFISQSTSRKFLDTVEELLTSSRTSPVVRERLLEVVAAAAYASGSKKDGRNDSQGFKGLWRRVKPFDKPEEGVPFDTEDAMFQPPQSGRLSAYDTPTFAYQEASPLPLDSAPPTPVPPKRKSPSNRIIPPEEDMRRLFQECKIGQGNAGVLSDALLRAKPEDLKKVDVIKEFHAKCRASQELIYAQIPWATSIAERSRANKQLDNAELRTSIDNRNNGHDRPTSPVELTTEEKLLDALLAANEELLQVLKQWDDLHRLAIERKVEDRSRKEKRLYPRHTENTLGTVDTNNSRVSSSRTPSPPSPPPSPAPAQNQLNPQSHLTSNSDLALRQRATTPSLYESDSDPNVPGQQQNLAPPPAAPHGPRSPAPLSMSHSRTPSPAKLETQPHLNGHLPASCREGDSDSLSSLDAEVPVEPSAKALGKRRADDAVVAPGPIVDSSDKYYISRQSFQSNSLLDPDFEGEKDSRWRRPPVHFVYDAVAERTRKLILDSRANAEQQHQVNGVH